MGWWVLAYHNNTIMIPFEIQMRIDPIKLAVVYGYGKKLLLNIRMKQTSSVLLQWLPVMCHSS